MKHATSRLLHAHWDTLRGTRSAPERGEIEPGDIRHVLADSFVLEVDAPARAALMRIAGTRLCALFGRELKGVGFAELWEESAAGPWGLVETVIEDTAGLVAGLRGRTGAGDTIDLELLLLPLRHRGKTQVRVLGALSAVGVPPWIGQRPLIGVETVSVRVLVGEGDPGDPASPRRPALVLHRGGLA